MELNYHKRSFQIIDDEPHFSAKNIQKIEEFENHHRIKLPLSLKEWYSIENHHTILQNLIDRTLNHTVILFENCHNFGSLVKTGQRSDNLLYVLEENQGCFHMAVKLTKSENPPVMFRYNEPGSVWELHAYSFSDWLLAIVWDSINSRLCLPFKSDSNLHEFTHQATELGPETYHSNMWLYASKFVRGVKDGKRYTYFI